MYTQYKQKLGKVRSFDIWILNNFIVRYVYWYDNVNVITVSAVY